MELVTIGDWLTAFIVIGVWFFIGCALWFGGKFIRRLRYQFSFEHQLEEYASLKRAQIYRRPSRTPRSDHSP